MTEITTTKTKLILALDIEEKAKALDLVKNIGPQLEWVKIGLQMFTKYGPDYIREISDLGKNIFLDLKLHDIPNTVAKAIESLSALPINMLTIHTSGGREMMEWAVKSQKENKPNLTLLGVTVLTSMDDKGLHELGVINTASVQVKALAELAHEAGMEALVCSPHEVVSLKSTFSDRLQLVTPGIRPTGSAAGDQKRIMTPAKAAEAGSDYIVVGRPIYGSESPTQAVDSIIAELNA